MEVTSTSLEGVLLITPRVFEDDRGWFVESFNEERYAAFAVHPFVQDNISCSKAGTLRGLHFQCPPYAQSKLVSVVLGSVQDIVVDLRSQSPTYGKHLSILLDAKKKQQLYIPRGFAHGFLALEDHTVFQYKCDNLYNAASEATLMYNDDSLGIDWKSDSLLISDKDLKGASFSSFTSPF